MNELMTIVGADMLTGINYDMSSKAASAPKVWNVITEFRVNIENEKPKIQRDLNQIES
jgi:hypothetical protein